MVQFKAHSDGKTLVPDEPVDLPKGKRFRVTLEPLPSGGEPEQASPNWLEKTLEISRRMPRDLPEDLAEQHDHYIHGTPKR